MCAQHRYVCTVQDVDARKEVFAEYDKDVHTFAKAIQDTEYRLAHNVRGLWTPLSPATVLDIGCGWGTNAAADSGSTILHEAAQDGWDGQWQAHINTPTRTWIGVDVAKNACQWCVTSGLYRECVNADVAHGPITLTHANEIDLVLVTGAAGYIGPNMISNVTRTVPAAWMFTLLAWEDPNPWHEAAHAAGRQLQHVATVPQRRAITDREAASMAEATTGYAHTLATQSWLAANVYYMPAA